MFYANIHYLKNSTKVFEVTHPSIIDAIEVNIAGSQGDSPWIVRVKLDDSEWVDDFEVFVKRTSEGFGEGQISGGHSYCLVTDSYREFFVGKGDRSNITVSFKLAGASDKLTPGHYTLPFKFEIVQEINSNKNYMGMDGIRTVSYNDMVVRKQ